MGHQMMFEFKGYDTARYAFEAASVAGIKEAVLAVPGEVYVLGVGAVPYSPDHSFQELLEELEQAKLPTMAVELEEDE